MRIDHSTSSSLCTRSLHRPALDNAPTASRTELARDTFQSVPPERLRGPRLEDLEPRFCAPPRSISSSTGVGYPTRRAGGSQVEAQRACLQHLEQLHGHLANIKQQYGEWKAANPNAREPSDGDKSMSEILELPVHEQCVRILCVIIHEQPQVLEDPAMHASPEPSFGIPPNEVPGQQPAGGGDLLSQLSKLFGPLAQMLGGLLSSPAGVPLLTAACALIPGAQVLLPAIPFIAPIAGQLLSGVGGSMAGQPGSANGTPDFGAVVSGITGLLGSAGAVAPA